MKNVNTKHGADYEPAKKRVIARWKKGFNRGSRDELHDRAKLRRDLDPVLGSGTEESS